MHATLADAWIWNGSKSRKSRDEIDRYAGSIVLKPEYSQMGPIAYGEVEIEEGASFNAVVKGSTEKKRTIGETSGSGTRRDLPERRIQNRCVRAGRGIKEALD